MVIKCKKCGLNVDDTSMFHIKEGIWIHPCCSMCYKKFKGIKIGKFNAPSNNKVGYTINPNKLKD